MGSIAKIGRLAPFIAGLLLGGCVNDVPVQPESDGTSLLWEEVAYPPSCRVRCIATDPDGRIFLGVDRYETPGWSSRSVYLSSDNGATWSKESFLFENRIESLASDSEGRIFVTDSESFIRSRDHGASWDILSFEVESEDAFVLVIDPADNIYLPTALNGIYFSGDQGDTWEQIGERFIDAGTLTSLDVSSNGCIFAIAGEYPLALFRSCDRGGSWTELQITPSVLLYSDASVIIDSRDRIFVNTGPDLYRSGDNGETWTLLERKGRRIYDVSIEGKDRLFCQDGRTYYLSEDGGDTWAPVLELSFSTRGMAASAPGNIFAAGSWGLIRSIDDGASWEMMGLSECDPADIEVGRNGYLYIGRQCGGVFRSTGDFQRWERFNAGFPEVRLLCLAPANDSLLMAGTSNGIYVSSENHPAWSLFGLEDIAVWAVFPLPGDSIAAFSDGLLISADGGAVWTEIGMHGYEIKDLIRTGDGRLLAAANFGGIFRYTGEGILWDQMNAGLDDARANDLAVTQSGDLLAGTDTGLFISSNGGESWRRFWKKKTRITAILVAGEDLFVGSAEGVYWTRTDASAFSPQNDGIPPDYRSAISSIEADPHNRLFLIAGASIFRSVQSMEELSAANLSWERGSGR